VRELTFAWNDDWVIAVPSHRGAPASTV